MNLCSCPSCTYVFHRTSNFVSFRVFVSQRTAKKPNKDEKNARPEKEKRELENRCVFCVCSLNMQIYDALISAKA